MTRPATALLAAAVTVGVVTGALVGPGAPAPATAQTAAQAEGAPLELTVTQLSGVLGPGSVPRPDPPAEPPAEGALQGPTAPVDLQLRALVDHRGDEVIEDLRVIVEVHPAATSRAELRRAVDEPDGLVGSPALHVHEQDLRATTDTDGDDPAPDGDVPLFEPGRLEPGTVAGIDVRVDGEEVGWSSDGGVHPVRIAILRGAEVLVSTVTAVVWLEQVPDEPLATTLVWPLDAPPWRQAGPAYPAGADADVRTGGRLDAQLRALERHPDTGALLAPPAHVLEDLQDRADGFVRTERLDGGALERREMAPESDAARRANVVLQRFRDALEAASSGPLARPYADADLSVLTDDADARAVGGELARLGRTRLDTVGARSSDQRAYLLPAGTTPDVLDLVPADTVLVPYAAIGGPDPTSEVVLGSPVRDTTSARGRPVSLIVGDPYVAGILASPPSGGPTLAAQRTVVETAMAYFEAPTTPSRALSIHPPDAWSPSAELAQALLGRLDRAPWLTLTDPLQVADGATRGAPVQLGSGPPRTRAWVTRLTTVLDDLEAASTARPTDGGTDLSGRGPGELRDTLLRATSRWYGEASPEPDGLIADVDAAIDTELSDVVIASGSLVTLTSDTGTIPVTLQRRSGGPVAVRVEVDSQGRLAWEDRRSETIVLEEGATQTVSFPTRALAVGTFSVSVRVTDPSGRLELDRTTLSVRSTSISGPALTGIAGLVAVLLLAGLVRRRPGRRQGGAGRGSSRGPRRPLEVVR